MLNCSWVGMVWFVGIWVVVVVFLVGVIVGWDFGCELYVVMIIVIMVSVLIRWE